MKARGEERDVGGGRGTIHDLWMPCTIRLRHPCRRGSGDRSSA